MKSLPQWLFCTLALVVAHLPLALAQGAEAGSVAESSGPGYHLAAWTNVFLPGGGEALRGRYLVAGGQFIFEVGTFAWGYGLSRRSPLTLDGVPEALPDPTVRQGGRRCAAWDSKGRCEQFRNSGALRYGKRPKDISQPLYADILQEVGLKTHMVNVFDLYRSLAKEQQVDFAAAQIDTHPTDDLFRAPFDAQVMSDQWVYIPLIATAGALYMSYLGLRPGDYQLLPPFTTRSTALYDFTYLGVFPNGSAAPEEMFYRGFLQSELYAGSHSRWLSAAATTILYTFSHSPEDYLPAALQGAYLGFLTAQRGGDLRPGIAYHFWSDVLAGMYAIALVRLGQQDARTTTPAALRFSFQF